MEAFLVSTGVVAIAEIGDKTQLLALLLAARFRKPVPIILGILLATLLNHGLAGALGVWLMAVIDPLWLQWAVGISFIAMGVWALVPDKLDLQDTNLKSSLGILGATCVLFFLAEIGDKTQIATIALAAHYQSAIMVVVGTTLGMLIANVPAVLFGDKILSKIPMKLFRWLAAAVFFVLGMLALLG